MKENEKDINSLRVRIDRLDDGLLRLLNERGKLVQKIGGVKARRQEEVYASDRERQILERLSRLNKGPLPPEAVDDIFHAVINNCRLLQKKLRVAYLGPEATFTHQAAVRHFGAGADFLPAPSVKDVFREVETERADHGVVPIENSTEGVVNHTLDMFNESDLLICAERVDKVSQFLLAAQGTLKDVKTVYSHPQALAQCRQWLEKHLPRVSLHEAASTADAAARAAMEKGVAAVAGALAGDIYRLKTLATHIEDSAHNVTRFLVIGKKPVPPSGKDKTSLLLSIKDRVGALQDLLMVFKLEGLNLTRIESRPTKKKAWQYVFFVDVEGHASEPPLARALKKLPDHCLAVKVLGSYPRAE